MHYIFSWTNPQSRYLTVTAIAEKVTASYVRAQLPAWRPGRYELGNFAKNVRGFRAESSDGHELDCRKITKDCWEVTTNGEETIYFIYEYYAAELNAGSTYLDEMQLYVNPVNCCIFITDRLSEVCTVELQIPQHWKVACALPQPAQNVLTASDFDRLADSPFIASPNLLHQFFVLDGVEFHLWFQGECRPDWSRIIADSFIYVNEMMELFGSFPSDRYHFFYQILPHRFYHGVEHLDSTVIALGPPYKLMKEVYTDFLGVSCHELFHAWNIKTIRPADMQPYDYTQENYTRLGYVCEGVTTYYGDYILFRSGVFKEETYWPTFENRLNKHFDTHGRHFLSVAEASFDTWLDGYVNGAPHRKTSIYHEGCLLAFITDIFIRRSTSNKRSLDDVMRRLWNDFARVNKGYTENDYKQLVEEIAGADFSYYWETYFYQANDYTPALDQALEYIGHELIHLTSTHLHESRFGFRLHDHQGITRVTEVYYDSPAERGNLAMGDEIVALQIPDRVADYITIRSDLQDWLNYFESGEIDLVINSGGIQRTIRLTAGSEEYYQRCQIRRLSNPSEQQKTAYRIWARR
jgi:predicted metalloprotease with PDZ domain